jgi:hypothetical protein
MKTFNKWLMESSGPTFYHVTKTDNVPKIKKEGILPLKSSNWVQAGSKKRYGNGEIFAFENFTDAVRWAFQMDWTFNKSIGTGKISIISFKDENSWDVDTADPISQSNSVGKWLKKASHVPPSNIIDVQPFTDDLLPLLK